MIRHKLGQFFSNGLLVAWTVLAVVPFVLIMIYSLRDNIGLYAYPLGVGGTYHPENYVTAWNGPGTGIGMLQYFTNTVIAGFVALAVTLTFGSAAAYFATKLSAKFRTVFLAVFLGSSVVPFLLVLIPYFQVFNLLSLLSQPAAIGVVYGVLSLPTTVLVLNSYFVDFPQELVEASAVDGLGEFNSYLRIVLPLSKGAMTAVGMLTIVYVWGEAQLGIVLLLQSQSQTVSVGLLGFEGEFTSELGPLFAGLTLATIPVIALYLIFNKYVTKGIALGGVFR